MSRAACSSARYSCSLFLPSPPQNHLRRHEPALLSYPPSGGPTLVIARRLDSSSPTLAVVWLDSSSLSWYAAGLDLAWSDWIRGCWSLLGTPLSLAVLDPRPLRRLSPSSIIAFVVHRRHRRRWGLARPLFAPVVLTSFVWRVLVVSSFCAGVRL